MRVLFLGEDSLNGSGRYLAAVLKAAGIGFDYRPDRARVPKQWRRKSYDAFILSDYRHRSFTDCARRWLIEEVRKGSGLLMIGGWASFTGLVGGYAGTELESLLPVRCVKGDDRVNVASGSLIQRVKKHPLLHGLSFRAPPIVCGYHRAQVKPGAETILSLRDLTLAHGKMTLQKPHPLLALGSHGRARTAAFLTDAAPHWAGGLVDWGSKRVAVRLSRHVTVEVGSDYLAFFGKLVEWVAGGRSTSTLRTLELVVKRTRTGSPS